MGADFMHDYLFNTYLVGDTRQQDCFDVFAQYDWMATRELEVVAAVRYDYFSDGEAPPYSQAQLALSSSAQPLAACGIRYGFQDRH